MTFDYLDEKKRILSADGKHPHLVLARGFEDSPILKGLGRAGHLKGTAFRDAIKILLFLLLLHFIPPTANAFFF